MKKLGEKARMYARSYGQPPYGRVIEGTAELLLQMADKLDEYEDTGITPEQIREIDRLYAEKCKELAERQKKLTEYEDLEEQGKLLKLPCAVGDTVYTNCSMQGWYFRKENQPYAAKVVFAGINGVDNYINVDFGNGHMLQFKFSNIGKIVFRTKEEAEAALNEKR